MNAKQISTLFGRLVEHQSELDSLNTEDAQWVIQHPKEAIALFSNAVEMRNEQLVICDIAGHGEFLGKGFTVWKGPIDGDGLSGEEDRDTRPFLQSKLYLMSLCSEESHTIEEQRTSILKTVDNRVLLGLNTALSLIIDVGVHKEKSRLEFEYGEVGISEFIFAGQVFRGPDGKRYVLRLKRHGAGDWDIHKISTSAPADKKCFACRIRGFVDFRA
ncbi:MAG: hypothetical protein Q8L10_02700 [Candidatus Moranbacteria bacterium]|nr:hypothetical protein [Candidatus Moranbacteria bacterium]